MYLCMYVLMHVCMIIAMHAHVLASWSTFRTDFADLAVYKAVCMPIDYRK